ncbi:MAG: ribosome small subunit-dependent GTPase A [Rhizobacter sp.]|nr:ribosome small subunit-dependent GTPase A [Chlorobiales bacterium]
MGTVIEVRGARFLIRTATAEGKVKNLLAKTYRNTFSENPDSTLVAVGDRVGFKRMSNESEGDMRIGEGLITFVELRRTKLSRTSGTSTESEQVEHIIASNVDQVIAVASATNPLLKRRLIDRYIVTAELQSLPVVIVVNKIDLVEAAEVVELMRPYGVLGYTVLFISAEDLTGLDDLREVFMGKTSVLSGHSGVGKSTIVNRLLGSEVMPVGEVSLKTLKGSHTTSNAAMLELPLGGGVPSYLIDTPGIRELGLWNITAENLSRGFIEFKAFESQCEYIACTHVDEPNCAVINAAERGEIDTERYESYLAIRSSLE